MNKTKILPIFVIAAIVHIATLLFINVGDSSTASDRDYYDSINAIVWLVGIALAIILAFVYRKELFKKWTIALTIPLLICCTPLPLAAVYWINHSSTETGLIEARLKSYGGKTYKTEHWEYILTSKSYVDKLYIIDDPNVSDVDDTRFKKHGKWVYLNTSGHTLKV